MAKLGLRRTFSTVLNGPLRTRFAPSPTGFMHLGGLRTALFNYLIAKKTGGEFLLRIEDTDQARTVPGAKENLIQVLKWTKLEPSPNNSIVQQSTRLDIYMKFADELVAEGKAYRCYCSKERLGELRSSSRSGYDGKCRNLTSNREDVPYVIRLRVPRDSKRTTFHDQVYGHISVDPTDIDDVILMKADGYPTYHFANVIDDHESGINLVMRGQEWLPSTPLHTLLYDIFGWQRPSFAHLPLLVKPDGTKLSKRHGDSFVDHYRRVGYLPEALVNFVAFLGWSPSKLQNEVMSIGELSEVFSLDGINKAESRVDIAKLDWLNRKHIGRQWESGPELLIRDLRRILEYDHPDLIQRAFDLRVSTDAYLGSCVGLIKDRIHTVKDIPRLCSYLFVTPEYHIEEPLPIDTSSTNSIIEHFSHQMSSIGTLSQDSLSSIFTELKNKFSQCPATKIMMTLRLALTGTRVGASLVESALLIGKEECMKRLALFSDHLKSKNY